MAERSNSVSALTPQERFFKYFQNEIIALQEQMSRLGDKALIGGERKDAADHCLASIARLGSEVKDASGHLPPYDLRTYTEAIKALQDKLAETQAAFAPKQKFAFKTKKNASAISLSDAAELAAQRRGQLMGVSSNQSADSSFAGTPSHTMTPPNESTTLQELGFSTGPSQAKATVAELDGDDDKSRKGSAGPELTRAPTSTSISSRSSTHIIVPASSSHAQAPCYLAKLKDCCVDLSIPTTESAPFASLTINNVHSSLLLCGLVAGPAYITGVKNSTLLIDCRQFRMHECENVTVYLSCSSRPIIEDCTGIKFAKLPDFYFELLHEANKNEPTKNMWDQVDDFKWLRAEQSPNWSVLSVDDEVPASTWKSIIPGKSRQTLSEILAAVNIVG